MTSQEIFDKVVKHLFKQKEPSRRNGTCMYRTSDGLKCAVGVIIPDEIYCDKMEGNVTDLEVYLTQRSLRKYSGFTKEKAKKLNDLFVLVEDNADLLRDLQSCHDDNTTSECGEFNFVELKNDLRKVAINFGLKTEHLKQLQ